MASWSLNHDDNFNANAWLSIFFPIEKGVYALDKSCMAMHCSNY